MRVSGIILAAGLSSRFEGDLPKQLLEFDGQPLVRRITHQALDSRLREVVVVVGYEAERVRDALQDLRGASKALRIVLNRDYIDGQASSVKAGLWAADPRSDAYLVMPIDQPYLDAATIDEIVDAYERSRGRIVVPTYRGRWSSPVLLDRSLFGELTQIRGDAGARQVFPRHVNEIVELPLASELPLIDIDTLGDHRRLLERAEVGD